MLTLIIEEFNCNHQADFDVINQVNIYARDKEKEFIKKFLKANIENNKSGLLYLCGNPGTGKTSTLNTVLSELKQNIHTNVLHQFEVFMFNAMTFTDVKSFGLSILPLSSPKDLRLGS